jgi:hypothetical protein
VSLLVSCADGPLAGASFTVSRCPRVVRCVRALDGTADILNEPEDVPRLDEEIHWYQWDGKSAGHVYLRGKERGCYSMVSLTHAPNLRELREVDPVNPGAQQPLFA